MIVFGSQLQFKHFPKYQYIRLMISLKRLHQSDAGMSLYVQNQLISTPYTSNRYLPANDKRNLKHSMTQKLLKPIFHHSPNIYLTNNAHNFPSGERIKHYASIKSLPSNKIIFKSSTGVSLKQTNISFSYNSPKVKRYHSAEARFSTKKFKEQHFPQIGQAEQNGSPIKRVIKSKQSHAETIYTKEKTPDKHKILKIKKEKQNKKIGPFNKRCKQNIEQIEINTIDSHINLQCEGPRNMPINALWMNESEITQKRLNNQQLPKYANKKRIPSSIEYIRLNQHMPSKKEENTIIQPPTFEKLTQPGNDRPSNKKYPTVQSLEVYEAIKHPHNANHTRKDSSRQDLTSLRIMLQEATKYPSSKSIKCYEQDILFARSISEQLQLHYDYCYVLEESDKSLSIQVSL